MSPQDIEHAHEAGPPAAEAGLPVGGVVAAESGVAELPGVAGGESPVESAAEAELAGEPAASDAEVAGEAGSAAEPPEVAAEPAGERLAKAEMADAEPPGDAGGESPVEPAAAAEAELPADPEVAAEAGSAAEPPEVTAEPAAGLLAKAKVADAEVPGGAGGEPAAAAEGELPADAEPAAEAEFVGEPAASDAEVAAEAEVSAGAEVVDGPAAESIAGAAGLTEADDAEPAGLDGDDLPALTEDADLDAALESLLLVVDSPVEEEPLANALGQDVARVVAALNRLAAHYSEFNRGLDLRRVGGGWRFYTRDRYAPYVERLLLDGQRAKLTRAALETLAVIAYRQPVTRARVAAVRGVNCDGVIRTLLARGLVEETGTDLETGGFLYRTTELFLERLGLSTLDDLPPIAPLLPEVDAIDDI